MKTLTVILTLAALHLGAAEKRTNLKPAEQIVFYPTVAQRVVGATNLWRAQIRRLRLRGRETKLDGAGVSRGAGIEDREMTGRIHHLCRAGATVPRGPRAQEEGFHPRRHE